jgi:hypothetical protein
MIMNQEKWNKLDKEIKEAAQTNATQIFQARRDAIIKQLAMNGIRFPPISNPDDGVP